MKTEHFKSKNYILIIFIKHTSIINCSKFLGALYVHFVLFQSGA
jgi:hypothetical protein